MCLFPNLKIIIVGAGPSGLLLALLLSKKGIPVHILEAAAQLDQQPRAAHYGPPAIPEFVRAGIVERIRERGMVLDTMCWRAPAHEDHAYIAGFNARRALSNVDGRGTDIRTHCLPLQDLDALMLEDITGRYGGVIEWEHRVVGVGQDADGAWCEVEVAGGKGGRKVVRGDYVVGCDGANSTVRKSLFGDEFPGFTWDAQIIATNVSKKTLGDNNCGRRKGKKKKKTKKRQTKLVRCLNGPQLISDVQTYYPFEEKFGWQDANFIIHPEHFFVSSHDPYPPPTSLG